MEMKASRGRNIDGPLTITLKESSAMLQINFSMQYFILIGLQLTFIKVHALLCFDVSRNALLTENVKA